MKPDPKMLFGNIFDDERIIDSRILNFGNDCLGKLIAKNDPAYADLISRVTPLVSSMDDQISSVDTALGLQKGTTLTVDELIELFGTTMKEQEGVIANAIGGFGTPAYLQFYPHTYSEYTQATKLQMPKLVARVSAGATAYAPQLGAPLTAKLQAFQTAWNSDRSAQKEQIGTVGENRTDRNSVRTQLEFGLLFTVHTIATMFPGDEATCSSFFDFSLLFNQTHHKHQLLTGAPAAGATVQALNQTLTDNVGITVRNKSVGAPIAVWLAETATSPMPANPTIVQPGDSKSPKPSALGDLKNTFLMIANLSTVNAGAYEVEVVGLKEE